MRTSFQVAGIATMVSIAGCATDQPKYVESTGPRTTEYHDGTTPHDMHSVMRAKLAHTQAIVEAIAMSDFDRIDRNSMAIVEISMQGEWMVHDTMAYVGFSDDFRNVARRLSDDARAHDLSAVTDDYASLVHSCVACHDYLRRERLIKDMPGRVSQSDVMQIFASATK